jgi:hypothetical protein
MPNLLQIGYTTEGTTDLRFLGNIIHRTFEKIALECQSEIEVYQPEFLKKEGTTFVEQICHLATRYNYFHIICIHTDSDSRSITKKMKYSINPAITSVQSLNEPACKNLVSIIPIQMTEAWMLADIDLLKTKIGTTMSNLQLGFPSHSNLIESISNPKTLLCEAIRRANVSHSRRRKHIALSSLYSPISQELDIERLNELPSYSAFESNAREAMIKLNYLT